METSIQRTHRGMPQSPFGAAAVLLIFAAALLAATTAAARDTELPQSVIDAAQNGLMLASADGRLLLTNSALRSLLDPPAAAEAVILTGGVSMGHRDPVRPAVAAIHAGWRGAAGGIVPATVAALHDIYGADPARLRAGIGPTIGPCCFEVGPEVIARFSETPSFGPDLVLPGRGDRAHLDLPAAIEGQLRAAGVRAENIERASLCTRCQNGRFFSYRAEGPDAGRFAAFIGLIAPGKAASAEAVGP